MIRIADENAEMAFVPDEVAAVRFVPELMEVVIFLKTRGQTYIFTYDAIAAARAAYKNFVSDLNHMLK